MNRKPVLGSGWFSVRWVSTINVPGNGLVPPQAPAASYMLRPTIAAQPLGERLVVLPVRAAHAVRVAAVVGVRPRATHHPVVETLAPDAEAVLRPVLRPHDLAVDRGRDGRDDLAHGSSCIRDTAGSDRCAHGSVGKSRTRSSSPRRGAATPALPVFGAFSKTPARICGVDVSRAAAAVSCVRSAGTASTSPAGTCAQGPLRISPGVVEQRGGFGRAGAN